MTLNPPESPTSSTDEPVIVAPYRDDGHGTLTLEGYGAVVRGRNFLTWRSWKLVFARVNHDFFLNAMMDRGGVLTFFTILTALPTLLGFFSLATLALASNKRQVSGLTDDFISNYIPSEWADNARALVDAVLASAQQSSLMALVSILIALFSASAYVRAFARSANAVYGRVEGRGLIRTWLTMWFITIVLVVGLVVIFVAVMLTRSVIEPLVGPVATFLGLERNFDYLLGTFLPVWRWLRWPVVFVLSLTLVTTLYHFAPNVRPARFRWITVGSIIGLGGATLAWVLVRVYLETFGRSSAYGALGTLVAALLALWAMNTFLVLGVKFDAEITRARELQRGLASEEMIHIPPRATHSALAQAQSLSQLVERGRDIRARAGAPAPQETQRGID